MFEGYYENGERNGKAKEYKHGKLIFEGEYKDGLEVRNCKEYYYNQKIKFEGEYIFGNRYTGKVYNINGRIELELIDGVGSGKDFDNDGNLISEGDFFDGGNGKEYKYYKQNSDEMKYLIFEGEYLNNFRERGKEYYKNDKLKFEGEYLFKNYYKGKLYDNNGNMIYELIDGNAKVEEKYDKMIIREN